MAKAKAYCGTVFCLALAIQTMVSYSSEPSAEDGWLPLPIGEISRISFGSCAKHWVAQPIWDAVIEQEPDLWVYLGDAIYADTSLTSINYLYAFGIGNGWQISSGPTNQH